MIGWTGATKICCAMEDHEKGKGDGEQATALLWLQYETSREDDNQHNGNKLGGNEDNAIPVTVHGNHASPFKLNYASSYQLECKNYAKTCRFFILKKGLLTAGLLFYRGSGHQIRGEIVMSQGVYTGRERRKLIRYHFDAEVRVEHNEGCFDARGIDFNVESFRVILPHAEVLPVGSAVKLCIIDELGSEICVDGEVFRVCKAEEEGYKALVIRRSTKAVLDSLPSLEN